MAFAFGTSPRARVAGNALALRLANAMVARSGRELFVIGAYQEGPRRRVVMWLFPREDVLRIQRRRGEAVIEEIKDVFSQQSALRKAAVFEGRNNATGFLEGSVLDHQSRGSVMGVAEFWVKGFLGCEFAVRGDAGSAILARHLQRAYGKVAEDASARRQLQAAILAIRARPEAQMVSLDSVANELLSGVARETFVELIETYEQRFTNFPFHGESFDRILRFKVLELTGGIYVTMPISDASPGITITEDGNEQYLKCEGTIVNGRIKATKPL